MPTGLLVLDMLEDFITGKLANPAAESIIQPIAALTQAARHRDDWLVVYGSDAHQRAISSWRSSVSTPWRTAGARVSAELSPQPGDIVVPKRFYSAFTQTDLDATCRARGIDRLVITGQHTECCCRHTSYDAFIRGIRLAIVADGTAAYEPFAGPDYEQSQKQALDYLRTYYGAAVTDTAELV